MTTTILIIAAFVLILTEALFWIFNNPGYSLNKGVATVTLQGKVQLWALRLMVPMMTGVNKSLGFIKYPMEPLPPIELTTQQGKAKLTLYRTSGSKDAVLPLYINHHGGGFVAGYADQDDMICRYLAHNAVCMVVNVDYVLAPEHPFPAQILQCYEIAEWLKKNALTLNIDQYRIAVGGQSAGASISAALCLMAKNRGQSLFCTQILNYGYFNTEEAPTDKFIATGKSQALGPKMLSFFQNLYLPIVDDRNKPFASPLLATDVSGLPDALIITAQYDLMKNDGNSYAKKLMQAGVNVIHREFEDTDHGFIHGGPKASAQMALELMVKALKTAFYHV